MLKPSDESIADLESKIKQGESMFDSVVTHESFVHQWDFGDTQLTEYIFNNYEKVLSTAIYLGTQKIEVIQACLSIIYSIRSKMSIPRLLEANAYEILIKTAQNLTNESRGTQHLYFVVMGNLSNCATKLLPCFSTENYMRSLLKAVTITECFDFIVNLINNGNVNHILADIRFISILVEEIVKFGPTTKYAQQIFIFAMSTPLVSEMRFALIRNNNFSNIIKTVINTPSTNTLVFIRKIYNLSISRQDNNWDQISKIVEENLPTLISIGLELHAFNSILEQITRLTCDVFSKTKDDFFLIDKLFERLSNDFFEQKHNTFLHNSFLLLLETYNNTKTLSRSLIKANKLFDKVYEVLTSPNDGSAVYYGQVRLIANIISPFFKSKTIKESDWKIEMTKLQAKEKIIKKVYGGYILNSKWMAEIQKDFIFFAILALFIIMAFVIFIIVKMRYRVL